jgi:hypothetical protein
MFDRQLLRRALAAGRKSWFAGDGSMFAAQNRNGEMIRLS